MSSQVTKLPVLSQIAQTPTIADLTRRPNGAAYTLLAGDAEDNQRGDNSLVDGCELGDLGLMVVGSFYFHEASNDKTVFEDGVSVTQWLSSTDDAHLCIVEQAPGGKQFERPHQVLARFIPHHNGGWVADDHGAPVVELLTMGTSHASIQFPVADLTRNGAFYKGATIHNWSRVFGLSYAGSPPNVARAWRGIYQDLFTHHNW